MNRFQTCLLIVFAFALPLFAGCDKSTDRAARETSRDIGTVTLQVYFGAGKTSKNCNVVCSPDSTVLMTLERAQQTGELKFESTGSGETTFVKSIDGLTNEGADGKNWIYRVNEKLGDKSAGIYKVSPGDIISWSWGAPPEELK